MQLSSCYYVCSGVAMVCGPVSLDFVGMEPLWSSSGPDFPQDLCPWRFQMLGWASDLGSADSGLVSRFTNWCILWVPGQAQPCLVLLPGTYEESDPVISWVTNLLWIEKWLWNLAVSLSAIVRGKFCWWHRNIEWDLPIWVLWVGVSSSGQLWTLRHPCSLGSKCSFWVWHLLEHEWLWTG